MDRACVICGTTFSTPVSRRTFCSEDCRKAKNRVRSRDWCSKNPDKVSRYNKTTLQRRQANGKELAYKTAHRSSKAGYLDRFLERAREANPSTDLTREYLVSIFGDTCAVCNVPFTYDRRNGTAWTNPYAPSIDRIDSSKPYQVGNVQIVLTAINFAKSEMTMENFTKVWRDIAKSWAALTRGKY